MIGFVAQGVAAPAGLMKSLGDVFHIFQDSIQSVGLAVAGGSHMLLAASMAIVIIKSWFEAIIEDDLVGLISTALEVLIVGTIALAVLQNYAELSAYVWEVCSGAMALFDPSGSSGGTTGSIMDKLWVSTVNSVTGLLNFYQEKDCQTGNALDQAACYMGNFVDSFALFFVLLVVMVLLLFYMAVMLLQIFRGIFAIGVGLVWLPFTAAVYPLIESWGKNALGVIMGGIAHMAMVSFLLGIVSSATDTLTHQAISMGFESIPGINGMQALFSRSWAAMVLGVMICVLALSAGTAISKSAEIFGTVSGMMSIHRGRAGGGGSKGAAGAGAKGAAAGAGDAGAAMLTGGGSSPGGAKLAGQAASGVAQAGAAVATGGASGVVSGAMAAAKGAMAAGAGATRSAVLAGNMASRTARQGGAGAVAAAAKGVGVAGGQLAGKAVAGSGKIGAKAAMGGAKAAAGGVQRAAKGAAVGAKTVAKGAAGGAKVGAKMGMALARNSMRN